MPQRIDVPGMGMVEFPDGMSDADMSAAIKRTLVAKQGPGETAIDSAKSLGAGLVRGAAAGVGAPGSLFGVMDMAGDYVEKKRREWGLAPQARTASMEKNPFLPTPADIESKITSVAGPLHEPQTKWGKYFNTTGEFLGNPLTYVGAGSMVAKGAMAIPSAIASEAAGQATEGTKLELPARIAGAVVGSKTSNLVARGAEAAAVPTIQDLRQAGDNAYNAARGLGVEIRQQPLRRLAGDIQDELYNNGRLREEAPATYRALDRLGRPTDTAGNPSARHVTVSDVESVRRQLQGAGGTNVMNRSEAAASRIAVNRLEDYMATLDPAHVAINPHLADRVAGLMQEGRGNWRAMRAAEDIAAGQYRAINNASAANSGGNINNAERAQLRATLNRRAGTRGYQDDEIAQMERVVRGTAVGNVARAMGNRLPIHGLGATIVGGGAAAEGYREYGVPGIAMGLAPLAAGKVLRAVGNRSTANQLDILDRLVRSNSPAGRAAPAPLLRQQPNAVTGTYEAARHQPMRVDDQTP